MEGQAEFEIIGARTPLGEECIEYINLRNNKENIDKQIKESKDKIINLMQQSGQKVIRVERYQISITEKSESLRIKEIEKKG